MATIKRPFILLERTLGQTVHFFRTNHLALFLLVFVILGVALWGLPEWQVGYLKGQVGPKDYFDAENSYRTTLASVIGGAALFIGVYFTWRRVEVSQEEQITERFTRAIEQLGSEKLEIRLGGIFALERIAKDSKKDHWTVMEVLCFR